MPARSCTWPWAKSSCFKVSKRAATTELCDFPFVTPHAGCSTYSDYTLPMCHVIPAVSPLVKSTSTVSGSINDISCSFSRLAAPGLFRMGGPKKLSDFLARDFGQDANRAAAAKNAYVLLGQHKPELAAAFFVLGASVHGTPLHLLYATVPHIMLK
jgi:RAVE protein 1 C terminal